MIRAAVVAFCLVSVCLGAYILHLRADNAAMRADAVASATVISGQQATIRTMRQAAGTTDHVTSAWAEWQSSLSEISPQVAAVIQGGQASDTTQRNLDDPLPADLTEPLRRMCDQARTGSGSGAGASDAAGGIHAAPGSPRPCLGFDGLTTRSLARLTARLYEHAGREGADKRAMREWSDAMGKPE